MEQQRDMVFCHECENEWYRDEHGLTCPECQSDFTEIIEAQHDPRQDIVQDDEPPPHPFHDHNPWAETGHAPDPDEDDISNVPNFQWRQNHPGGGISMTFSHTFNSDNFRNTGQQPRTAPQPAADPLMQNFAQMLNGMLAGRQQPQPQQQQDPDNLDGARPSSSQNGDQARRDDPNVRVHQGGGPGFHYTATTRLYPRDAHNPQPQLPAFDDLPNLLNHMFQAPPRGAGPDPTFTPQGGLGALGPLAGLFAGIMNPANMQHGDAVYSQEALDRIISQLMEQNQSGNAPGPATAEAIASLPKKQISKDDLDESSGQADCSICMDAAPLGSEVTVLPCTHWFHPDCIKAWLTEHDTCPHCRQGIMAKDGPENASQPRQPGQTPRNDVNWGGGSSSSSSSSSSNNAGSGGGTREDPFIVPESPVNSRRRSSNSANSTLFSRMRDAFGSGSGDGSPGPAPGSA